VGTEYGTGVQRQAQMQYTTKVFEFTEPGESRINTKTDITLYKLCPDFLLLHPVQILFAHFLK